MDAIDVTTKQSNGMTNFGGCVLESQEIIGHLGRTRHFASSLQAKHKQIQHESIVLRDERCELKTSYDSITVCVIHVLISDDNVILCCHVIGDVVIDNQPQETIQKR